MSLGLLAAIRGTLEDILDIDDCFPSGSLVLLQKTNQNKLRFPMLVVAIQPITSHLR